MHSFCCCFVLNPLLCQDVFEVKATRPIAAGDDVCISYLGLQQLALPCDQRRAMLRRSHGFACACRRCRDEDTGVLNATSACNALQTRSRCCGAQLVAMQDWCVSSPLPTPAFFCFFCFFGLRRFKQQA